MARINNLKDRRNELPEMCTVADYEKEREKNLKKSFWACVCGSRKFRLLQHKENVKAVCLKCGNSDIIYWNGTKDSSKGSMKRLDTNKWVKA
jgi:hypothetical protein